MATKRESKKVISNVSREAAEASFADYSNALSNLKKLEAEMELKITKVREKYGTAIANFKEEHEKHFALLQTYALENEALFEKKKSIELTHGTIGFRTGTPALKTLKGFTWKSVVNLVKTFLPEHVRTVDEVNKETLLANRDNEAVSALFEKCGIEVKQDEAFYVEVKEEVAA